MTTCRQEVLRAVTALMTRNGGQPLSPAEIQQEMTRLGTTYPASTIQTHIVSAMCVNAPKNHATKYGDLRRVGRGQYVLVDDVAAQPRPEQASYSRPVSTPAASTGREWPWEGSVQYAFADFLSSHGWHITELADTAAKVRGVDVLAGKGARQLGAEVKGWPSTRYADQRRAGEVKPTHPTNQAAHWFAEAVLKALMLLDTHPGRESLVVLPDQARYRDLAARSRTGRAAAGVHVVFVREDATAESETWAP